MTNLLGNFKLPLDPTFINNWTTQINQMNPTANWLESFQNVMKVVKDLEDTNLDYNIMAAAYLVRM